MGSVQSDEDKKNYCKARGDGYGYFVFGVAAGLWYAGPVITTASSPLIYRLVSSPTINRVLTWSYNNADKIGGTALGIADPNPGANYKSLLDDVTRIGVRIITKKADEIFVAVGRYPSYKSDTKVIEFITKAETEFVRVFKLGENSAVGSFLARSEDIKGLSPEEIKNKLSLEYVPDMIGDIKVPAGINVRTGIAAPVEKLNTEGGAIQYELLQRIDPSNFTNQRKLE